MLPIIGRIGRTHSDSRHRNGLSTCMCDSTVWVVNSRAVRLLAYQVGLHLEFRQYDGFGCVSPIGEQIILLEWIRL